MKKIISLISISLILTALAANGQSIEEINAKIDSLKEISDKIMIDKEALLKREKEVNTLLNDYMTQRKTILAESGNLYVDATVVESGAVLRKKPMGEEIAKIPGGAGIMVYSADKNLYFKVKYNKTVGYISYSSIESNPEVDMLLQVEKQKEEKTIESSNPDFARLSRIYGPETAIRLINHELWKGMTHGMVIESQGRPLNTMQHQTNWGLREIWKYKGKELVFINGELTNWEDKE